MLRLFRGTCEAIRAMHDYRAPVASSSSAQHPQRQQRRDEQQRHSDDDERFPHPEGDAEGGYSYDGADVPLVTKHRVEDEGDVIFEGDQDLSSNGGNTELVPYAHRDIKPGYVCLVYCSSQRWLTRMP